MLKHTMTLMAIVAVALLGSTTSFAAVSVSAAGSMLDEPYWHTAGMGDIAYQFWGTGSGTELVGGELDGGFISHTNHAASSNHTGDTRIQIEDGAGGMVYAGYSTASWYNGPDTFADHSTYTFGAGTPSSLAMAVLVGAMDDANGMPIDVPDKLKVTGDNSVVVETTAPSQNQADWYFFQLDNISEGDSVTLAASGIADVSGHTYSPVNGVAFAVPEPATLALLGLGGLGTLLARRKRR